MKRTMLRALILLVLLVLAVAAASRGAAGDEAPPRDGELSFAASLPEADRTWVRGAIAAARPEARRLIDEADGAVEVGAGTGREDAIGRAEMWDGGARITLDTVALNSDRALDRNVVVLHELGHVVDHVLVPDELVRRLDEGIPRVPCHSTFEYTGGCTAVEERFADTFAKWALGGAVSLAGSGYGVPAPASLEDWGAPLGRLAARLDVE